MPALHKLYEAEYSGTLRDSSKEAALIFELPHGDSARARIYKGPTLFSDQADQIPITGEFRVVNGKVEMLVHIQDRTILYIFDGTQFKPQ